MRALLKPVVWVCLFFFAYQSTYAQALKIMSYNCRMSGRCNVARDRLQHKKE